MLTLTADGPLANLAAVKVVGLKGERPGVVVVHGCIVACEGVSVQRKVGKISDPGGQVVANDDPEDEDDGGGREGGEDEFVFGLLLHAPIITQGRGDASKIHRKISRFRVPFGISWAQYIRRFMLSKGLLKTNNIQSYGTPRY